MTREDAKAILEDCLYKAEYKYGAYGVALKMAIKALEQEPCEDWYDVPSNEMILKRARQASKDLRKRFREDLEQEPKTGHWINTETKGVRYAFWCRYKCSLCGGLSEYTNFCPNCGARMIEPQERSDRE